MLSSRRDERKNRRRGFFLPPSRGAGLGYNNSARGDDAAATDDANAGKPLPDLERLQIKNTSKFEGTNVRTDRSK